MATFGFKCGNATCHTVGVTLDVLRPVFADRIISHRADIIWPARKCELSPFDYYLSGTVRDKCYADKDNIREAIGEIQFNNVLKNCTDRMAYCMASQGSHLNKIILHY